MDYIKKIIEEINKEIVIDEIKKIITDHGHKFDNIIRKINTKKNELNKVMINS